MAALINGGAVRSRQSSQVSWAQVGAGAEHDDLCLNVEWEPLE